MRTSWHLWCGVRVPKLCPHLSTGCSVFVFIPITKKQQNLFIVASISHVWWSLNKVGMRIRVIFWADSFAHAYTLRNGYSCTELFNVLNIWRRRHAWRNALKTTPHTGGTCLRQLLWVTLSSSDDSGVHRASFISTCSVQNIKDFILLY